MTRTPEVNQATQYMFSEQEIKSARNRYFPGWWACGESTPEHLKPLYIVRCQNLKESELVKVAQPSCVRVKVIRETSQKLGLRQYIGLLTL